MARHYIGDISVFDAGGSDLRGTIENVNLSIEGAKTDVSLTSRITKSNQTTKKSGRISCRVMSTASAPTRVSHLNLTALTLDAANIFAYVRSMELSGVFEHQRASGVGEVYEKPEVVQKGYTASVVVEADTDVLHTFVGQMAANNVSDADMVLAFTLNGVSYSFKMTMDSVEWGAERNGMQTATISLSSRDDDTGDSPTSPIGTTTLLEKAFNQPRTLLAFSFTGKSADSFNIQGNMCWESFSFAVNDGEIVYIDYAWMLNGTPTYTQS